METKTASLTVLLGLCLCVHLISCDASADQLATGAQSALENNGTGNATPEPEDEPVVDGNLRCYVCTSLARVKDECETTPESQPQVNCNKGETCFKTDISDNIRRGCTVKEQCSGNVYCCDTKLCNGSRNIVASGFVMIVAMVAARFA